MAVDPRVESRRTKILEFLRAHPGEQFTAKEICDKLFPVSKTVSEFCPLWLGSVEWTLEDCHNHTYYPKWLEGHTHAKVYKLEAECSDANVAYYLKVLIRRGKVTYSKRHRKIYYSAVDEEKRRQEISLLEDLWSL